MIFCPDLEPGTIDLCWNTLVPCPKSMLDASRKDWATE